jgi:YD repeat-containing protein
LNLETVYSYNLVNQMMAVTRTRGTVTQTRSFSYNMTTLRLMSENHPESGITTFLYNADGTLWRKTLANGKTVTFSYDAMGRVVAMNSDVSCENRWHYYDDASRNAMGRLWKVTYGSSACASVPMGFVEEYRYSASGNATQKTLSVSDSGGQVGTFPVDYTTTAKGG